MPKTLVKHGNSYALVIDKPIMDLLKFEPDTPLEFITDGRCLVVMPTDPARGKKFRAAMTNTTKRYGKMLKRLAE